MAERHVWIPMADGVRLAVSLFLPDTGDPCPVLLEALPYRKDDVTAGHRTEYERLASEHGYAVARVDLRGTGSSEGVATDEYPPQEQADLCRVIGWLAAQPWSTGAVGMYGTSYSGFNSLQVAAERPPALKAIVAIHASDDRYTDDVHYVGGALRLLDLVDYPLYMVALNALPPVPALAGRGWRQRWRERVEGLEPWLLRWLQEQVDGPYWRHGSLRPGYERIACPTMIVAGWADGYHNATFRVLERLRVPARLLLGPWSHMAAGGTGGCAGTALTRRSGTADDPAMRRRPALVTAAALLAASLAAGAAPGGRRELTVGTLRLRPPGMTWNDKGRHPRATVTGRAGGDRLAATLPAP
jgi:predicted acyl esterase